MLRLLPSFIAESTATGIESFKAQEKSTIKIASAFKGFLVIKYVRAVAPRLSGTNLSAR